MTAPESRAPSGTTTTQQTSEHVDALVDSPESEYLDDLDEWPELDDDVRAALEAAEALRPVETEEQIDARVEEIVRRIEEVDAGRAVLLTTEEVMQSLRAELGLEHPADGRQDARASVQQVRDVRHVAGRGAADADE